MRQTSVSLGEILEYINSLAVQTNKPAKGEHQGRGSKVSESWKIQVASKDMVGWVGGVDATSCFGRLLPNLEELLVYQDYMLRILL